MRRHCPGFFADIVELRGPCGDQIYRNQRLDTLVGMMEVPCPLFAKLCSSLETQWWDHLDGGGPVGLSMKRAPFPCSSLEIDLAQRVLTRLCTTCHGGRLTCQSEESCPQVAIRGEKKVARCPLWGKSGVSHRKSPLGVAASQGDSTLAQVTGGQTPPHRAPAALSLS